MQGLGLRLSVVRPFFALQHTHDTLSRISSRSFTRTAPNLLVKPFPLHIRLWLSQPTQPAQRAPSRSMASFPFPFSKPSNPSPSPSKVAEISRLETAADSDPNNVDVQVQLFRALLSTELKTGYNVIMSRWERLCEFNSESPVIHSDEAFQIYLTALAKSDLSASINAAAQRRDALLRAHPVTLSTTSPLSSTAAQSSNDLSSQASDVTPVALPPSSRSQEIAQAVLNDPHSGSSSFSLPSLTSSQIAAAVAAGGGHSANPIHVVISEPRSAMWRKIIRSTAMIFVFAFFGLVFFAMILENTSLLKTGPRAAEFEPMEGNTVKFSDVHGVDEAKDELQEVVDFLKDPTTFTTLGGQLPKGILLTGSPGTGKTMLARAVAGEAGVPFLFASGSEFEEVFVGVGAKRVRELFATARKKQPAIIFIDELDAIGGKRSNRDQNHLKQTLNQLLVEMDGFMQSEGVIVIAATNFPESLDQALVRPGRFDRIIAVPLPDVRGRVQILQHHMLNVIVGSDADPMILARGTPGFSGADLKNMVNQAAIQASKEGASEVTLKHFEWAKDRILMGAERKSHYVEPKEKRMTAYHEGGHAIVALLTEGAMPLHKVTCVRRGHALGMTMQLPEGDVDSVTKKEFEARLDVAMAGRAAEELIYGSESVTSGASADIRAATSTANAMVRQFGYSKKLGPVFYHDNDSSISSQKREIIESEIQRMIEDSAQRAMQLLIANETELHRLADALVEFETLDADEVRKVIKGERIRSVEERLQDAMSHAHQGDEQTSNSDDRDSRVLEYERGSPQVPPQNIVS